MAGKGAKCLPSLWSGCCLSSKVLLQLPVPCRTEQHFIKGRHQGRRLEVREVLVPWLVKGADCHQVSFQPVALLQRINSSSL